MAASYIHESNPALKLVISENNTSKEGHSLHDSSIFFAFYTGTTNFSLPNGEIKPPEHKTKFVICIKHYLTHGWKSIWCKDEGSLSRNYMLAVQLLFYKFGKPAKNLAFTRGHCITLNEI